VLKGDFHMHTRFSHDCMTTPEALVRRCQDVGLNCIAVTEHNNIQGALAVQALASFMVIVGEEIKTTHGEITGLFLTEEVPRGLSPLETVKRIKGQGGLVSLPHPFDRLGRSPLDPEYIDDLLSSVDIVEAFNARTTLLRDNARGHRLGVDHDLLVTAVSDAHTLGELGRTYTELPDFNGTAEGFKTALADARLIERRSNPLVHLYSTLNKFRHRRWAKKQ
jgi:predicted metal-dependent phosphoesterase TrpH